MSYTLYDIIMIFAEMLMVTLVDAHTLAVSLPSPRFCIESASRRLRQLLPPPRYYYAQYRQESEASCAVRYMVAAIATAHCYRKYMLHSRQGRHRIGRPRPPIHL